MIRKLMMVGLLLTFLSAATCAFAEDVYVTQRGKKYHKEICRLVKNKSNITELEKEHALEEGYDPCKRCFQEDVVVFTEESGKDEAKKDGKKEKLG